MHTKLQNLRGDSSGTRYREFRYILQKIHFPARQVLTELLQIDMPVSVRMQRLSWRNAMCAVFNTQCPPPFLKCNAFTGHTAIPVLFRAMPYTIRSANVVKMLCPCFSKTDARPQAHRNFIPSVQEVVQRKEGT